MMNCKRYPDRKIHPDTCNICACSPVICLRESEERRAAAEEALRKMVNGEIFNCGTPHCKAIAQAIFAKMKRDLVEDSAVVSTFFIRDAIAMAHEYEDGFMGDIKPEDEGYIERYNCVHHNAIEAEKELEVLLDLIPKACEKDGEA